MFRGLCAFPPTPTDDAGIIQTGALGGILERIRTARTDSVALLGSSGGYAYLTRRERLRAVHAARECIGGNMPIVVGVGALRTDEAQALARDASAAGADGLLIAPMSYTPLTEEEVYQHIVAVAEVGGLPLCIYNNPSTTKFTFSDNLIVRLAKIPNIMAVKMPLPTDGDFAGEVARLRTSTPDNFSVGYSGDWGAADALLSGCDAWYSVVAGLLPEPSLKLTRAARTGDVVEAQRINNTFQPLWDLFKEFGSFRVIYVIMNLLGLGAVQPPRPILPLSHDTRRRVEKALHDLAGS